MNAFLKNLYGLFKDLPSRRATYTNITDSKILFRCNFVSLQVECVILIVPHLSNWIQNPSTKLLGNKLFLELKTAEMDPLILSSNGSKLHFFLFVFCVVEPFLRKFQISLLLSPFIREQLESLLRNLLMKFMKPKVLVEANTFDDEQD